jgi:hypothetical protein
LILILSLSVLALAACGGDPTPTPTPEKPIEPLVRGDTVVVFGTNDAFTIVYDAEATFGGADFSNRMATEIYNLGLKKPEFAVDAYKTETKCELLVGNTTRALSAEAKAIVEKNAEADPRGDHWIYLYKDGQLAIYANSHDAYDRALSELTGKYYKAGEITVKTNTKDIGYVAGPHDAYMEYEVPSNFYDGYTDPFGMEKGDYKEMVVSRVDDTKISIDYYLDGKTYYRVNFVRKRWGMWMLGAIAYVDKGTAHQICPGSTDYEFVFRCGNEGSITFSSGNHADYSMGSEWDANDSSKSNDRLLDMTLYDAKTGKQINLPKVGNSITVSGLRIVMHHNIYEINYTQSNVLANAERSYLYNGYDVMCDTKLYMAQDVKLANSFSCMLPVNKPYGNCAMFYATDGSTVFMHTPDKADVSLPEMSMGVKADYIDIWGENNSALHIKIKLNNIDDQLRNSTEGSEEAGYTGIRNMPGSNGMGSATNKIYCSCFSATGEMDKGESLNFSSCWSFSYEPDFVAPDRAPDRTVGYD